MTGFLMAGFDYRTGWSRDFPRWLPLFSEACLVCGFALLFQVMKVNHFASSTIQVEAGQKVISTGPYRSCGILGIPLC